MARQLISTYSTAFHRHHFYYLAAFYAAAVYGIGAQIVARALLGEISADFDIVEALAGFVSMLGLPFLFVSWLMLIALAYSLYGKSPRHNWMQLHALVVVFLVIGASAFLLGLPRLPDRLAASAPLLMAGSLALFELFYFSAFCLLTWRFGREVGVRGREVLSRFSLLLIIAFVLRTLAGTLVLLDERLAPIALVAFFGSNLLPVMYIRAMSDAVFEPVRADSTSDESMDAVFDRHGITKRERQIIREVCLGKTNQQIADTLFIGLQTVKDHTHRIYSKLGIRNRIQLVQLMSDSKQASACSAPRRP